MTPSSRWIYAVSFILIALGFFLPFWPLSVCGILLCSFSGRYAFAVFMALILDIAWGAPTGRFMHILFPFTALSLVFVLIRYFGVRYVLDRNPQEKL